MSERRRSRSRWIAYCAAALAAGLLSGQPLRAQPADSAAAPSPAAAPQSSSSGDEQQPAESQPSSSQPEEGTGGVEGLSRARQIPEDAFGSPEPGIPYSSVLTPTGANLGTFDPLQTYPFRTNIVGTPKLGETEGNIDFAPGNVGLMLPLLRRGTEPDNANIKLGPFYLKFNSLDATLLYSDNYRLQSTDRTASLLLLMQLNMTLTAQLSDDIQITLTGSLGYLPLQGQFGFESNLFNSLGALLVGPLLASQFVYDTVIAGWPVRFADDFQIAQGQYSNSVRDNFDLFRGDALARDDSGDYTFRSSHVPLRSSEDNIDTENSGFIVFVNSLSAVTTRELPGEIEFTGRIEHDDLWYNQANRGLPSERDDLTLNAISVRDNLRFKPFANYELAHVENIPGVYQVFRLGVLGPITDQLFMRADAGYYTDSSTGHNDVLFDFNLKHDAGPYTTEQLSLYRDITDFGQEISTGEYYQLVQTLGPTLEASGFLENASYQELVRDGSANRTEDLAGLEILWFMGPKTKMILGAIYEEQRYNDGGRSTTFTGRVTLDRTLTDTLSLQLLYQYQNSSSNIPGDSYFENVVFLRIIKYFE